VQRDEKDGRKSDPPPGSESALPTSEKGAQERPPIANEKLGAGAARTAEHGVNEINHPGGAKK